MRRGRVMGMGKMRVIVSLRRRFMRAWAVWELGLSGAFKRIRLRMRRGVMTSERSASFAHCLWRLEGTRDG